MMRIVSVGPQPPELTGSSPEQAAGMRVHWVESAAACLAGLSHSANGAAEADAVLCDVTEFSPALLRALHEARPGLPVVVMASEAEELLAWQAVEQGADDYVLCTPQRQMPWVRLAACGARLNAGAHHKILAVRRWQLHQRLRPLTWDLNTADDLARLISTLADEARRVLPYEQLAIYLVDPDTRELALCAVASAHPQPIAASLYHLRPGAGTTAGLAVVEVRSCRVDDFTRRADLVPALGRTAAPPLAELSFPILDQSRAIGAITLTAHDPTWLNHAEEELAWLSDYVALAIRAAGWARRVAEHETREALLTSIGHTVNSSLGLRQVLQRSVSEVGERLRVDRCVLAHLAVSAGELVVEHEYINPLFTERRRLNGRQFALRGTLKHVARLLQKGKVMVSSDEERRPFLRPLWNELSQRYDVRSLVCVPLPDQTTEDFYGLVVMQATHVRAWTEDDLALLRGLADQLALALRNARLFDAMESAALELQSKNAELEAFVYTVSHDLQAPVVSLRGFASLLQTRYGPQLDARGATYVTRIAANAEFLAKMLQDLLELSRVGRLKEPNEDIAVGSALEPVLHDVGASLTRRAVNLILPPTWPTVRYSPTHLRQVFSNLLSNAVKFLGPQAEPRVELGWRRMEAGAANSDEPRAAQPLIEFFVRDNGIGIHPDYHERILGAFQRLKVIDVEGTGVGLSIVKRIVELHGGTIRVQSAPDAGSTFYFTALEAGPHAAERTEPADPPANQLISTTEGAPA